MSAARALFAGPGARRTLINGRGGAVEIVFAHAAYIRLEQDWVLLAEPGAPVGPLSLCVYGLDALDLAPGVPVGVVGARLHVGEGAVSLERVREHSVAAICLSSERSAATAAAAAESELPAIPGSLADGIASLAGGRPATAVKQLAGLGSGLTPAGDDVLAGYAASRFVVDGGDAARPRFSVCATGRCSPLGLAYLRCAERGELPDPGARLLGAICAGSLEDVRLACSGLRSWGASSGTALAWGITAGFRQGVAGAEAVEKVQVG